MASHNPQTILAMAQFHTSQRSPAPQSQNANRKYVGKLNRMGPIPLQVPCKKLLIHLGVHRWESVRHQKDSLRPVAPRRTFSTARLVLIRDHAAAGIQHQGSRMCHGRSHWNERQHNGPPLIVQNCRLQDRLQMRLLRRWPVPILQAFESHLSTALAAALWSAAAI